jgi:RND family efflux transporter MFP subunit
MKKLILFLVALILIGCSDEKKEIVEKNSNIVKIYDISKSENLKNRFEFPANVYSYQNVNMAFELSGKIVSFSKSVGDRVKKGEVLARIDDTIYKANLLSAKSTYNKAKLDYDRYKRLYKSNSVAKVRLESAKQALDSAKANYNIAQKNMENTKLIAEFDGVIAKKMVDDFARVTAKQTIVILQDNSKFKIKFNVPERYVLQGTTKVDIAHISMIADFYVKISDRSYKSTLIDISTTADEITRTYELTLMIPKPKDKAILAGMTASVEAIVKDSAKKDIYIPLKALFSDHTDKKYVWLVDDKNIVHKKSVTTSTLLSEYIKVIEGLNTNDRVVVSGVHYLKDNQQITPYKKIGQ